jgi:hypothetical protein
MQKDWKQPNTTFRNEYRGEQQHDRPVKRPTTSICKVWQEDAKGK